jgi:alkyl sulfatase BDS1-like metallo-beta-lactamase superfamily hydrolase
MRLNGPKAENKAIKLNFVFPDTKQRYAVELSNGALSHLANRQAQDADATVRIDRATLNEIVLGGTTLEKEITAGKVKIDGDAKKVNELVALLDKFEFWFNIVTP